MPSFVVNTNVSKENVTQGFLSELTTIVAKLTGKPESYVTVCINADQLMMFGGSGDPCASCYLENIGGLNNEAFTKGVNNLLQQRLGIPTNRSYVFFRIAEGRNVGHGTTTFG